MGERITLGISACLTGAPVRYDGGDRLDPYLINTWGRNVDFLPLCPEAGAGLGVPREPMRLTDENGVKKAVGIESGLDRAGPIRAWSEKMAEELAGKDLHGLILKSKSPSCAGDNLAGGGTATGIFRDVFSSRFPLAPVATDKEIQDHYHRDLFVSRIFLLKRWRDAHALGMDRHRLIEYHTTNKLWFLAHSPETYRLMGRVLADPQARSFGERTALYQKELLNLLRHRATETSHANVLHHVAGYFRRALGRDDRLELAEAIEGYKKGDLALAVPLTLANHYARKTGIAFLGTQTYLHPHPLEIKLRS